LFPEATAEGGNSSFFMLKATGFGGIILESVKQSRISIPITRKEERNEEV
jgi:hypothetical protein